jgi:hypothetical protein
MTVDKAAHLGDHEFGHYVHNVGSAGGCRLEDDLPVM